MCSEHPRTQLRLLLGLLDSASVSARKSLSIGFRPGGLPLSIASSKGPSPPGRYPLPRYDGPLRPVPRLWISSGRWGKLLSRALPGLPGSSTDLSLGAAQPPRKVRRARARCFPAGIRLHHLWQTATSNRVTPPGRVCGIPSRPPHWQGKPLAAGVVRCVMVLRHTRETHAVDHGQTEHENAERRPPHRHGTWRSAGVSEGA